MTALATIYRTQIPVWDQEIREFLSFEAIPWTCVMAAATLDMNFNDGRYPNYKPSPEDAAP